MLAENPVLTLARLLGGVVLMQGRLGHQVLGQLLVSNTNEVAVAGAAVVIAATSETPNAVAQVALRTAAPALAARILIHRDLERLERRETLVADRERRFAERARGIEDRDQAVGIRERELEIRRSAFDTDGPIQETTKITSLETENRRLQGELERLSRQLRSLGGQS